MVQYQRLDAATLKRIGDDGSESFGPPNEPTSPFSIGYQAWVALGNVASPPPLVYSGDFAVTGRVRTTNATPTEIYRLSLAQLTGYWVDVKILGVDAGNGAVRAMHVEAIVKRLGNGALAIGNVGMPLDVADVAASTWTVSRAVAGNDVIVTVTGAAGRTIDWQITGTVRSFTPAGA
jgi:hypothetical protein